MVGNLIAEVKMKSPSPCLSPTQARGLTLFIRNDLEDKIRSLFPLFTHYHDSGPSAHHPTAMGPYWLLEKQFWSSVASEPACSYTC